MPRSSSPNLPHPPGRGGRSRQGGKTAMQSVHFEDFHAKGPRSLRAFRSHLISLLCAFAVAAGAADRAAPFVFDRAAALGAGDPLRGQLFQFGIEPGGCHVRLDRPDSADLPVILLLQLSKTIRGHVPCCR